MISCKSSFTIFPKYMPKLFRSKSNIPLCLPEKQTFIRHPRSASLRLTAAASHRPTNRFRAPPHTAGKDLRVGELKLDRGTLQRQALDFHEVVEHESTRFVFRGSRDESRYAPRPSNRSHSFVNREIPTS